MSLPKRILLLSAYTTDQQRYWIERLKGYLPETEFTEVLLSPDNYAWRVRGNALTLALDASGWQSKTFDLCIANSMVDLATVRGLCPALVDVPCLVYFHDNPFAYPDASRPGSSLDAQWVAIYTALAADACWFNSVHNMSSFLSGSAALLEKHEGEAPGGVVQSLLARSQVIPTPLDDQLFEWQVPPREIDGPIKLLWGHRWGFDKGPERLLALVKGLDASDLDVELVLPGPRSPHVPQSLHAVVNEYSHMVGFNEPVESRQLMAARMALCHVAVSTARHDFQGLNVMEASVLGNRPLLPDRLAYPEYFESVPRYRSSPDVDAEALSAIAMLRTWMSQGFPEQPDLSHLKASALESTYLEKLGSVAA